MKIIGLIVLVILGFSIAKKMLSVFCLIVTFVIVYFYFYPGSYDSVLTYVTELSKLVPSDLLPSAVSPSKIISTLK